METTPFEVEVSIGMFEHQVSVRVQAPSKDPEYLGWMQPVANNDFDNLEQALFYVKGLEEAGVTIRIRIGADSPESDEQKRAFALGYSWEIYPPATWEEIQLAKDILSAVRSSSKVASAEVNKVLRVIRAASSTTRWP